MADVTPDGSTSIEVKSGPVGLKLIGKDSLVIFLFLVIAANIGITLWQHLARSQEHEEITCHLKLNLYMQAVARGSPIEWEKMPIDLYKCVPKFLFERRP